MIENAPNRIREIRLDKNIPSTQIAEELGTSTSQIHRFETGERVLDLAWGRRIARALGVSLADLLPVEDAPHHARDPAEVAVLEAMRRGEEIAAPVLATAQSLSAVADRRSIFHAENDEAPPRRA